MSQLVPPVPTVDVFPVMADWSFQASATIYSGTKVFVDAVAAPAGFTTQAVPNIGDSWDTTYAAITCKTIRVSYTGNNPTCPRRYECYYDSTPIDISIAGGDPKRLPVSMQIGTMFKNYPNPNTTSKWYWKNSGADCGTTFFAPLLIGTKTISIVRYIAGADLDRWSKYTDKIIGTVNNAPFWPAATGTILMLGQNTAEYEFSAETLLYHGADLVEHTNNPDNRRWECTLKFEAILNSNDNGTTFLGWNYEWNSDTGKFDKPQHKVNGAGDWVFAYRTSSFPILFSTGAQTFIPNSSFPTL